MIPDICGSGIRKNGFDHLQVIPDKHIHYSISRIMSRFKRRDAKFSIIAGNLPEWGWRLRFRSSKKLKREIDSSGCGTYA